jgi:hypothetical protein
VAILNTVIAQLVERSALNRNVEGSSPSDGVSSSSSPFTFLWYFRNPIKFETTFLLITSSGKEMGCDYYQELYLKISTKSGECKYITLQKNPQYLMGGEYDSDFMTFIDYLESLHVKKPVVLYKEDKWLCLEDAANGYTQMMRTKFPDLKMTDIHTIEKTESYYPRY